MLAHTPWDISTLHSIWTPSIPTVIVGSCAHFGPRIREMPLKSRLCWSRPSSGAVGREKLVIDVMRGSSHWHCWNWAEEEWNGVTWLGVATSSDKVERWQTDQGYLTQKIRNLLVNDFIYELVWVQICSPRRWVPTTFIGWADKASGMYYTPIVSHLPYIDAWTNMYKIFANMLHSLLLSRSSLRLILENCFDY